MQKQRNLQQKYKHQENIRTASMKVTEPLAMKTITWSQNNFNDTIWIHRKAGLETGTFDWQHHHLLCGRGRPRPRTFATATTHVAHPTSHPAQLPPVNQTGNRNTFVETPLAQRPKNVWQPNLLGARRERLGNGPESTTWKQKRMGNINVCWRPKAHLDTGPLDTCGTCSGTKECLGTQNLLGNMSTCLETRIILPLQATHPPCTPNHSCQCKPNTPVHPEPRCTSSVRP